MNARQTMGIASTAANAPAGAPAGDELWRIYILLTRAENAFRDMKSPLAERPIFHHTEPRTEAHIFLCVLAR